jgi:Uma2 family endonuclease
MTAGPPVGVRNLRPPALTFPGRSGTIPVMPASARKMTYADYARIPADGHRHEVIGGEEIMTPAPDVPHQRTSRKLERLLDEHVIARQLGEVFDAPIDVVLSPEDVVQPDIVFIAKEHSGRITQKNIQGAPDLVIEILSPSTAAVDRGAKLALYERAEVSEYWLVDPAAKVIEIRELESPRRVRIYKEGQSFESRLLTGLMVRLADVF